MSFTYFQNRLSFFSKSLIVITLVGFLLRVLAARGELWFDEILTLKLLDRLSSADEIFSRLPHVNNHLLNSLWLWIAGKEADPVWRRFASILLGAATIPAAAMFIRRAAGEAAGLATALIFAVGHIFVHYGSEARGYAGLVLMIVLCADAADRLLRDPLRKGPAVQFALCVALGALFQFTMIAAVGVVGAATAVLMALDFGRFRDNSLALLRLSLAAIVGLAPAGAPAKGWRSGAVAPSYSMRDTRRPSCSQVISRPCRSRVWPLALRLGLWNTETAPVSSSHFSTRLFGISLHSR